MTDKKRLSRREIREQAENLNADKAKSLVIESVKAQELQEKYLRIENRGANRRAGLRSQEKVEVHQRERIRRREEKNTTGILHVPPVQWFARLQEWLTVTKHSLKSMSLLRILYGLAMVWVLSTSYKDRHYMWGEASTWIDPAVALRAYPEIFEIFPKNNPGLFDFFFIVLILLAVMFTVGLFTKAVSPILLIMWVGLSTNSVLLTNGGDVVMRITLLFLLFANLNEHFSVDNLIRARFTGGKPYFKDFFKINPIVGNVFHNTALVLAAYQVILVYVNSGILKLMGSEWRDGTALYYALTLDVFMPFPAMSEFFRAITPFIFVGSVVSIWAQLFFPVLLIWRPTRYFAVIVLTTMHFGIALMLGLWPFSMAMIGLDLLFVSDKTWRDIFAWFKKFRKEKAKPKDSSGRRRA